MLTSHSLDLLLDGFYNGRMAIAYATNSRASYTVNNLSTIFQGNIGT
jgi:hypothetical protein